MTKKRFRFINVEAKVFSRLIKLAIVKPTQKNGTQKKQDNHNSTLLLPVFSKSFEKPIHKPIINF